MAEPRFVMTQTVKGFFVDRPTINRSIDKAGTLSLGRAGAFIRTRARSLLRRRKRSSSPGQPPSVHSTNSFATLRNIWFAVENRGRSLVVGPARANQVALVNGSSMTVPELQEKGGNATIFEESYDGINWYRRDLRRSAVRSKRYRARKAKYPARSFMLAAFEREREANKLAAVWNNSVRAA